MIPVSKIYKRAKAVFGACGDEALFEKLTEAVDVLANKGEFDPLLGYVDVVPSGTTVTLPSLVETVLGVTISGIPVLPQNRLYEYHLNGPGGREFSNAGYRWARDGFSFPTFITPEAGFQVAVVVDQAADLNCDVWVEGQSSGVWIRTQVAGQWVDGYKVPTSVVSPGLPVAAGPVFDQITRVRTSSRKGAIRLYAIKDGVATLIAIYQWNETEPMFRRLLLDQEGETVRILFRRKVFDIQSVTDLIPLHSVTALLEACRAVKALGDDDVALSMQHEATALRFITEKENTIQPPFTTPIQVDPRNVLHDKADDID
jgi:hypothetical protein